MRLFGTDLIKGMLVRYGTGETALAQLRSPHAGGWHGQQCMGGIVFIDEFHTPSQQDLSTWERCANWRNGEITELSFHTLRSANLERRKNVKYKKCEAEWTPSDWAVAFVGEVGEACNIWKKVRRGDMSIEDARPLIAAELADAQTYLDILASELGIDLAKATIDKFNVVSERIGSRVYIGDDDHWHLWPENFKHE